jgi:potassium-transporting ATPase KdpC subunit
MIAHLRPTLVILALATALTGVALPLLFVGIGEVAFPFQAGGSLIHANGKLVGSALIGQNFTTARYFQPRPSALSGTDPKDPSKTVPTPYDASESGASNLGPAAQSLHDRVRDAVAGRHDVPGDAVTTSGSGLDPDISPANAETQIHRVATARHLPDAQVADLVAAHTKGRFLGLVGEPRVNVLELNLALDGVAR